MIPSRIRRVLALATSSRISRSFLPSLVLLLGISLSAPVATASALDGAWSQIASYTSPSAQLAGRTSFTLVLDAPRDRMIAFSGDPNSKNDVWSIGLAPGSVWMLVSPIGVPPGGRYGAAAIVDPGNDRMLAFGGFALGTQTNDVWALSLSAPGAWTQIFPSGTPPTPRQDVAAVYDPVGHRMILFGGYTVGGLWSNEVWALSLIGPPMWTELTPAGAPPLPRNTFGSAFDSSRNRMLVFGGWSASGYLNDTWALDLAGAGSWSQITTATLPPSRRQCSLAYDAGRDQLVLFGGYNGANLGDTWRLPLSGVPDWVPDTSPGPSPTPRYGSRAIYDPTRFRFLVCGGVDVSYRFDVSTLDLSGPRGWSTFYDDLAAVSTHPTSRREYSLAIDPATSTAYLFGGTESYGIDIFGGVHLFDTHQTHSLALSNPTPIWQTVDPAPGTEPSARHGHRAVWDPVRHRMLVFGGYDGSYLNDLYSMTPGSPATWQQLLPGGAPPDGRMHFGFGYDPVRDRLIVVGGHSGFPPSGTQPYRIDAWALPLSGVGAMTWVPLAPAGTAPNPRWIYGMTYDPLRDRMMVFGGVTASGRPNDVWALNLAGSTSWAQLSPLGPAPSGRSDHTMVYDSGFDRLIVFGGYDGSFKNDVWALNLAGPPAWSPLSPSGPSPSPRDILQAVFDPSGARMLIYGGWDGASILPDTWLLGWSQSPVAIAASLMSIDAQPGVVRMNWFVPGADHVQAVIERAADAQVWRDLGDATRVGPDQMTYEDHDVVGGREYRYRLHLRNGEEESTTAATSIVVPMGAGLALLGASPNPASDGQVRIAFSLPRPMRARLELIDPSGRRLNQREVGSLGAGRHQTDLGQGVSLSPGVYWVRLVTDERSFSSKVLVVH